MNEELKFDDTEYLDNYEQELADKGKKKLPWYTFDHSSWSVTTWDLFIIVLAIWNCLYIPFEVAFKPEKTTLIEFADRVIDVLFFTDIIINFMTSYVNPKT